ncbi:cadmium-translocating P-type ATPase [Salicibibacter cibarius]|uniref:P-type Cu(+) transporter n=2 Tax=Salicibibacter TaxID=2685905 RepID=A0A514LJJ9_9BACI|nr:MULTISPECIES: copper-translocating P-type ATPase [Salicibibacter]QDI91993.1 cadmium-translocating P-type ATPase [Salicibibacter halophilus]QQK74528.1 cadmium-translocating P-type ATPase [Salicibibacter cibarius]
MSNKDHHEHEHHHHKDDGHHAHHEDGHHNHDHDEPHSQHDHHDHDHEHNRDHDDHAHHSSHGNHSSHGDDGHSGHGHHGHGNHEDMMADFKKRFFVTIILAIPIIILSDMIQMFFNYTVAFPGDTAVELILASIVFFYGGWPFLTGLVNEIKDKSPGMMTLIGFAITVAYVYSAATVFGLEGMDFFWELATLIAIMLLGHWIEMKSVMKASDSLESLVELMPQEANKLDDNDQVTSVAVSELKKGDRLLIKPGEKIPADGHILKGKSSINESMLTGESEPVEKGEEDEVIGGAINSSGSLTIEVSKTSDEGYLSQVVQLVKEAQESKSKTQMLSDRAAKLLFYVAVVAGIVTFSTWMGLGVSTEFAVTRMVTVLVISCPHALGLAIPLVAARSTGISAQKGLFIRNRIGFESARRIDTMIFDKTGTLTHGEFGVTDILPEKDVSEEELLRLAASLESQSEHPIAAGVVAKGREENIDIPQPEAFDSMTGAGITGKIDGKTISVVSPGYLQREGISYDERDFSKLAETGKTVVFVLQEQTLLGAIALADVVKESAKEAVERLHQIGIETVMLTGDNEKVAQEVAKQIGIDQVIAEVLPHEKAEKVKELKIDGKRVGMTGDGINDAPALANADLGVAVGAGTDVAMETADVVLVNSDPLDVVSIVDLSRVTYRKMIQNLWWAAGYNIVAIPLAAGVLATWGFLLDPALGAVLMSLSTVIVAINAQTLKMK